MDNDDGVLEVAKDTDWRSIAVIVRDDEMAICPGINRAQNSLKMRFVLEVVQVNSVSPICIW